MITNVSFIQDKPMRTILLIATVMMLFTLASHAQVRDPKGALQKVEPESKGLPLHKPKFFEAPALPGLRPLRLLGNVEWSGCRMRWTAAVENPGHSSARVQVGAEQTLADGPPAGAGGTTLTVGAGKTETASHDFDWFPNTPVRLWMRKDDRELNSLTVSPATLKIDVVGLERASRKKSQYRREEPDQGVIHRSVTQETETVRDEALPLLRVARKRETEEDGGNVDIPPPRPETTPPPRDHFLRVSLKNTGSHIWCGTIEVWPSLDTGGGLKPLPMGQRFPATTIAAQSVAAVEYFLPPGYESLRGASVTIYVVSGNAKTNIGTLRREF